MGKINITNLTILLLFQVVLFFSCRSAPNGFEVKLLPEDVHSSVAYGTLLIDSKVNQALIGVKCDGFERVEWHESKIDENQIMRMIQIPYPIHLVADRKYSFQPGGSHLMLFGRTRKLIEGENLRITFSFSDLSKKESFARVVK